MTSNCGAELTGWGRYPAISGNEISSERLERVSGRASLSRALGRSYGDASLPAQAGETLVNTCRADCFLEFNPQTGLLRAEAGLSLQTLKQVLLPRHWFTPVTPGTQFVTLGGMVAADVHGKNHHVAGCFGEHVSGLRLRVGDGRIVECSDEEHPELFRASLGGMGLTGHILEVEVQLEQVASPWIWAESERISCLETLLGRLKEAGREWPFTVSWVDALSRGKHLGRGHLMLGRWAEPHEAPTDPPRSKGMRTIPREAPNWLLNRLSIGAFNSLNYWKHQPRVRRGVQHPDAFFYPLDGIGRWNLLYGKRGFTQYQCVLPDDGGVDVVRQFLLLVQRLGGQAYLVVIKDCGPEGKGLISFPKPGISIALDMPIQRNTQQIVDELNAFVLQHEGRIYLAKDAFTRAEDLAAMYARLEEWQRIRRQWDPSGKLRSAQSVRVFGDHPSGVAESQPLGAAASLH